jgi:hypothetical protein
MPNNTLEHYISQDSTVLSVQFAKLKRTLLKDQGYNLTTIKEERLRIDARLKEKGFYYFAPDYLKVQVTALCRPSG